MVSDLRFASTAIGSLPHNSVEDAISLVRSCFYDMPFVPQLANVDKFENMSFQILENLAYLKRVKNKIFLDKDDKENLPSTKIEDYEITRCCAFKPLLENLKINKPKYLKTQIIGPFTLSMILNDKFGEKVFFNDFLRKVIFEHIKYKALWLANKIREQGIKPVIFLDEPSLSMIGPYSKIDRFGVVEDLKSLVRFLKDNDIIVGIHCCGKCDWSIIIDSEANILSFDAFSYSKDFALYSEKIEPFLKNNGIIAWGIVPTLSNEIVEKMTIDSLYLAFYISVNCLTERGIDKNLIFDSAMITPSCGTGNLSVELSEKAMLLTKELSMRLKEI